MLFELMTSSILGQPQYLSEINETTAKNGVVSVAIELF